MDEVRACTSLVADGGPARRCAAPLRPSAHIFQAPTDRTRTGPARTEARGEYELLRLLDFILEGSTTPTVLGPRVLWCAQHKARTLHRRIHHGGGTDSGAAALMARALENTTRRTGDAMWAILGSIPRKFGYTRHGYSAGLFL